MKYRFVESELKYDGSQLKSLFAYMNYNLQGDSIVAFIGPCDVSIDHMVDGEDLLAGSAIRGARMLHFIIEEFGEERLELAVTRQRLFASIVRESLVKWLLDEQRKEVALNLSRHGDDLFYNDGKLSISIATVSPVSRLIHFALNINNENTPVKTAALDDLGIPAKLFAERVVQAFTSEIKTIKEATCKVRWVP